MMRRIGLEHQVQMGIVKLYIVHQAEVMLNLLSLNGVAEVVGIVEMLAEIVARERILVEVREIQQEEMLGDLLEEIVAVVLQIQIQNCQILLTAQ